MPTDPVTPRPSRMTQGGGPAPKPPRLRARAMGWRGASFASLDFETTGLDLSTDVVVSFGVVPIESGRARMGGAIHQLVSPSVPPSPRSQTVHELRPQDLVGSPAIDEARRLLASALAGRFLLAWFADVEVHLLGAMFGGSARRWRRRTIDVRNLAIALDGAPIEARAKRGYGLSATAGTLGVPVANSHDALDDALVTAQLFLVLASKVHARTEPTVRHLLRLAGA